METGTTQLDSVYSSAVSLLLCGGAGESNTRWLNAESRRAPMQLGATHTSVE